MVHPPEFSLKPARIRDAGNVTGLFRQIDPKLDKASIRQLIRDKKVYLLKERKKVVAGFSYATVGLLGFFSVMFIRRIAVSPSRQRNGIGTTLLGKIKWFSLSVGASAFALYSVKQATRFYEKNRETHQLKGWWRFFWWKRREKVTRPSGQRARARKKS